MLHQQTGLAIAVEHAHGQLELCDPGPRIEPDPPRESDADDRQLELTGVKAGARWRRKNAKGAPIAWAQIDLQLAGIKMRRRRAGTWALHKAAIHTMSNVRAQTYCAADLGALDALSMPAWARGRWELTPNEEKLLGALWRAYANGTGGLDDCSSTIASDLGMSERTLRNSLNGRGPDSVSPRPGLIERGLVHVNRTHKQGRHGRKCDDSWLLLRIGPELEAIGHELVHARGGAPRGSGYSRTSSRRARQRASSDARRLRKSQAQRAWRSRGGERTGGRALAKRRPKFGDDPRWLAMHGIEPDPELAASELAARELPRIVTPGLGELVADCFRQVYGERS